MQLANAQFGFRVTQFQRAFHAAVFIGRATIALHRQQAGVDPVRVVDELEPEQADDIDANADRPLGVTGLGVEDKALGPLLGLRLPVSADNVRVVPAGVVIACLQGNAGIIDKTAFGGHQLAGNTHGDSHGQQRLGCMNGWLHRCALIFVMYEARRGGSTVARHVKHCYAECKSRVLRA